ncbi:MAG: DUF4296 domain-containing protein [Flavobacteriales bacterium]|jgi:hypothetical protein|nr:DUF4296 domain-containing protein [Flavobacteriales bacterium]
MRRVLAAVMLAATACGGGPGPMPEGTLPRDTFKELLVGAHLIEAHGRHRLSTGIALGGGTPQAAAFDSLYAAHGTDSAAFRATFAAYADRPHELKAVYEEVLTEILRRKDEALQ